LHSGERITLRPGVDHEFRPTSERCVIGEVYTANDDLHDNYFADTDFGRYPEKSIAK
jgi:D-lyxose ketol-isomerase